jgi:hypothetical protein
MLFAKAKGKSLVKFEQSVLIPADASTIHRALAAAASYKLICIRAAIASAASWKSRHLVSSLEWERQRFQNDSNELSLATFASADRSNATFFRPILHEVLEHLVQLKNGVAQVQSARSCFFSSAHKKAETFLSCYPRAVGTVK